MSQYVYVGNLDSGTDERRIEQAFVAKGHTVKSALVMRSPRNDRSRGFGFVELETEEEAAAAIQDMNGVELDGRPLKVAEVRERPRPRESRGDSFGGPRRSGGARRR